MYIFERISKELAALTPGQIQIAEQTLEAPKDGETILHVIQGDHVKRLWALAHHYEGEGALAAFAAKYKVDAVGDYATQEVKAHEMEGICRALAWIEIRHEAGDEKSNWNGTIGLRENFTLVATTSPVEDLAATLGAIALPAEMIEGLLKKINDARERRQREREAKRKVQ